LLGRRGDARTRPQGGGPEGRGGPGRSAGPAGEAEEVRALAEQRGVLVQKLRTMDENPSAEGPSRYAGRHWGARGEPALARAARDPCAAPRLSHRRAPTRPRPRLPPRYVRACTSRCSPAPLRRGPASVQRAQRSGLAPPPPLPDLGASRRLDHPPARRRDSSRCVRPGGARPLLRAWRREPGLRYRGAPDSRRRRRLANRLSPRHLTRQGLGLVARPALPSMPGPHCTRRPGPRACRHPPRRPYHSRWRLAAQCWEEAMLYRHGVISQLPCRLLGHVPQLAMDWQCYLWRRFHRGPAGSVPQRDRSGKQHAAYQPPKFRTRRPLPSELP
jgi:hypothetical protein